MSRTHLDGREIALVQQVVPALESIHRRLYGETATSKVAVDFGDRCRGLWEVDLEIHYGGRERRYLCALVFDRSVLGCSTCPEFEIHSVATEFPAEDEDKHPLRLEPCNESGVKVLPAEPVEGFVYVYEHEGRKCVRTCIARPAKPKDGSIPWVEYFSGLEEYETRQREANGFAEAKRHVPNEPGC